MGHQVDPPWVVLATPSGGLPTWQVNPGVKEFAPFAEMEGVTDALTCPQCAAAARPDAAWCSLCFAPLVGGFDPLTAPLEEVLGEGTNTAVLTQAAPAPPEVSLAQAPYVEAPPVSVPRPDQLPVGVPYSAPLVEESKALEPAGAENAPELSDVDVMLAMLASEHRQSDPSAEIVDRMGDKGTRVMVIVGGTIAIAVVAFVLMAVIGTIL